MQDNPRLQELVLAWRVDRKASHSAHLGHYEGAGSIDEAIFRASRAENGPDQKRNSHQRRLGKHLPALVKDRLLGVRAELEKAQSFDRLYAIVESSIRVHGIGPLMTYDTALRIGAFLGVYPEKVYLQCGALEGARTLLRSQYPRGVRVPRALEVSAFPKELQMLRPNELENFLCTMRRQF